MRVVESAGELLPQVFRERMRYILANDFQDFLDSYGQPRTRGLRLNPGKISAGELQDLLSVELEPVPWCPAGFVFPSTISLGGHPAHLAGLFYLQEPSSMIVAEVTDPSPGSSVIDLAASPGGKTTHLSDLVGTGGLVVANEVIGSRLRPLHDNLDLWGSRNVVTVSRPLDELVGLGAQFDATVLDAPCSGEGLFRRDPASIRQWSVEAVQGSARRQSRLLSQSAGLARRGGVLLYSTCTFAIEENEERVAEFLESTKSWELEDLVRWPGVQPGWPMPPARTERTARLWPHRLTGEGQFVARMRHIDENSELDVPEAKRHSRRVQRKDRGGSGTQASDKQILQAWQRFHAHVVPGLDAPEDRILVREDRVFLLPEQQPRMPLEVLARPGLPLGRLRPGRFEPHPALAAAIRPGDEARRVAYAVDSGDLVSFLRGETVQSSGRDGWTLVCLEKWGIGWAKRSQGTLKNMLPQHLRRQASRRSAHA